MRDAIKKYKAKFKDQGGFTLIELMAVLAILALIAIIAVPAIGSILQKAGDNADASDVDMIEKAAGIAYVAVGGTPSDVPDGEFTVAELVADGYLDYDNEADGARNGTVELEDDGTFTYVPAEGEPEVKRGDE